MILIFTKNFKSINYFFESITDFKKRIIAPAVTEKGTIAKNRTIKILRGRFIRLLSFIDLRFSRKAS